MVFAWCHSERSEESCDSTDVLSDFLSVRNDSAGRNLIVVLQGGTLSSKTIFIAMQVRKVFPVNAPVPCENGVALCQGIAANIEISQEMLLGL